MYVLYKERYFYPGIRRKDSTRGRDKDHESWEERKERKDKEPKKEKNKKQSRRNERVTQGAAGSLDILPLWKKPSNMEHVAVDCLIKAKSGRKDATELGVHRQTLSDAMGRMRCAALPVTQCKRAPRNQQDAKRKREKGGARRAFYFVLFAAVATSPVR